VVSLKAKLIGPSTMLNKMAVSELCSDNFEEKGAWEGA